MRRDGPVDWSGRFGLVVDPWAMAVWDAVYQQGAMAALAKGMTMSDMWTSMATHLRALGLDDQDAVNAAHWVLHRWGQGTGIDSDVHPTNQRLAREAIAKFVKPMPPTRAPTRAVVPSVSGAHGAWHIRADGKRVQTR